MSRFGLVAKVDKELARLSHIKGLVPFLKENCFLAGGAVRDITRDKTPKDYDIFFKTPEALEEFKSRFSDKMSLSPLGNYNFSDFQFITMYTGSINEVLERFDWNVNQAAYDFNILRRGCGGSNQLLFNVNSDAPLSALLRLPYLLSKGFEISPQELLFVTAFLSERNLFSPDKVEEQLGKIPSEKLGQSSIMTLSNTSRRARDEAIKHSPLWKVLDES